MVLIRKPSEKVGFLDQTLIEDLRCWGLIRGKLTPDLSRGCRGEAMLLRWGHLDHRNRREAISGGWCTVVHGGVHLVSEYQRQRGNGGSFSVYIGDLISPFVFSDAGDDDDLMEEDPSEFDTGFGNILVVDNLPVVPKEKFEKLEGVVQKIYSQLGVIKEDGLWMPVDPETQKTLRYCFIEYNTPQEAELSKEKTHGYKLDMSHIFVVNMFDDIEKFLKVPDEWARPEIKPYVPRENLQQWLTDEKARDQFVIRACNDTEVLWNDARQLKPELVYKRSVSELISSLCSFSYPFMDYLCNSHGRVVLSWSSTTKNDDEEAIEQRLKKKKHRQQQRSSLGLVGEGDERAAMVVWTLGFNSGLGVWTKKMKRGGCIAGC
uniref:Eukaryotic translation initiation factor 3 subunit B-like n=1 Tax=Nicotiana sylvestris TaxID=4096 RepID=A0A1U7XSL5_NICSY|nr:PREDICTED: eukaryotic translation initiation factor 3 subunit B-like [Nicotiana sylvestris]